MSLKLVAFRDQLLHYLCGLVISKMFTAINGLVHAAQAKAWKPIEQAPQDDSEIWAFNGEQGRMKWSEGGDGSERWALWVWADELLSEVDPSPAQPTHFTFLLPSPTPQDALGRVRSDA